MIRRTIVDLFKRDGLPPPFEKIASETGISPADVAQKLSREDRLDDLCGLSLKQAFELIEFYGPNTLFVHEIAENVQETVAAKRKIERIEARELGGSGSPPTSGKNG